MHDRTLALHGGLCVEKRGEEVDGYGTNTFSFGKRYGFQSVSISKQTVINNAVRYPPLSLDLGYMDDYHDVARGIYST